MKESISLFVFVYEESVYSPQKSESITSFNTLWKHALYRANVHTLTTWAFSHPQRCQHGSLDNHWSTHDWTSNLYDCWRWWAEKLGLNSSRHLLGVGICYLAEEIFSGLFSNKPSAIHTSFAEKDAASKGHCAVYSAIPVRSSILKLVNHKHHNKNPIQECMMWKWKCKNVQLCIRNTKN